MSTTLNLTESNVLSALRSFLECILPTGTEVIKAQVNRVPEPWRDDFVVMTPILRGRLSTNVVTYLDNSPFTPPAIQPPGTQNQLQPTRVTVQLDVHGPLSADNAQIISTLLRSEYACDQFTASGFDVQPLYAGEPHQAPFVNGEQQVEYRWVVDAVMQANPVVSVPQQFADSVTVGIIEVDAKYPPAA